MNNKIILQQMIRLSRIIKDSREARAKLNSIQAQTEYFIEKVISLLLLETKLTVV